MSLIEPHKMAERHLCTKRLSNNLNCTSATTSRTVNKTKVRPDHLTRERKVKIHGGEFAFLPASYLRPTTLKGIGNNEFEVLPLAET